MGCEEKVDVDSAFGNWVGAKRCMVPSAHERRGTTHFSRRTREIGHPPKSALDRPSKLTYDSDRSPSITCPKQVGCPGVRREPAVDFELFDSRGAEGSNSYDGPAIWNGLRAKAGAAGGGAAAPAGGTTRKW